MVSIDRSEKRFGLLVIHIVDGRGNLLNHGVFSFFFVSNHGAFYDRYYCIDRYEKCFGMVK